MEKTETVSGFVHQSLQRNNKQIRSDRAASLAEDLEIGAKRQCEDLGRELRKLKRKRESMYDFSPSNSQSLVLAAEVDGEEVAEKDMVLSLKIRDLQIKFDIACERYEENYGKKYSG
jgi:hypothetical protein